jgi:hypothetical protein
MFIALFVFCALAGLVKRSPSFGEIGFPLTE